MNIERSGKPDFSRPRKLTEINNLPQFQDVIEKNAFGQIDEREIATDDLYTDLTKTFFKGKAVLEGLSKMDPAQFIPIEEAADSTRAAATRLDKSGSNSGEILTYSLFQKAVSLILDKKWELRGDVIDMKIPASVSQQTSEVSQKLSNVPNPSSLIKEFIAQNGIVTTIIGMLTLSPFQTVIFQALGVEEGAKGVQIAQIPAGIALFLELGIKAERILAILKESKISTPLVEQQVVELSNSDEARAAALGSIGIDYNQYKKSQEFQDGQDIVKYVTDYYQRYGGLDRPNGHLTIDHWIAYLHVAQNQQTIKGALNTSVKFSPKFASFQKQFNPSTSAPENMFTTETKKHSKIFAQLASATRSLKENSDTIYDNIVNSFNYQLRDSDLCCLVEVFGKIGNPELLYTIASILRILATSLSAELLRIQNLISKQLANLAQDALFELVGQINEFYYKILHKITKAFTVNVPGLEHCGGLLTLGWALLHGVETIFNEVKSLIQEISSIIGDFGLGVQGSWKICGDRRELLGMAHLLETLAARLDLANHCASDQSTTNSTTNITNDSKDFDQALFNILGERPPNLAISDKDKQRHFNDLAPATSERLKFSYGINSSQNSEINSSPCSSQENSERIASLVKNLTSSIQESFNG